MAAHFLKTVQPYFDEVWEGRKKFEVRNNDRDFKEGDYVYLQEFNPENNLYSGKEVRAIITYVLKEFHALSNGYVAFSFNITQHINKPPYKLINHEKI
jgi:hypothetical protein